MEEPGGKISLMKMSTFTGNSKNSRRNNAEKRSKKSNMTISSNNSRQNSKQLGKTNQSSESLSESDESDPNQSNKPIRRGVAEHIVQETGTDKFLMSKESYRLLQKRSKHLTTQN